MIAIAANKLSTLLPPMDHVFMAASIIVASNSLSSSLADNAYGISKTFNTSVTRYVQTTTTVEKICGNFTRKRVPRFAPSYAAHRFCAHSRAAEKITIAKPVLIHTIIHIR